MRVDAPVEEDLHLRAVLETQPVTLVRLGRDGRCSPSTRPALPSSAPSGWNRFSRRRSADLLQEDDRSGVSRFHRARGARAPRLARGGPDRADRNRHTIQIHAVPHPGAPDGIESVLVTLRDVTESRRLEQSLVDAMARQAEQEAAHEAARHRLAQELDVALQSRTSSERRVAQIAELKGRLRAAEMAHASAVEQHTAELLRLNGSPRRAPADQR